MAANLTPQYLKAEKEYRAAQTLEDKLAALKKMLSELPKHKGTEKIHAGLKTRLSELKVEMETRRKTGRAGVTFRVPKEGAAQIVLLGYPNVGKSQIVARLTGAHVEVADYPFTTRQPAPGMMRYEDIQIQLVDTPPLSVKGMEPGMLDLIRAADAAMLVLDLSTDGDDIRPDPLEQADSTITRLSEVKIHLVGRVPDEREDPFVVYLKTLLVGSKVDVEGAQGRLAALEDLYRERYTLLGLSARDNIGLDGFGRRLFDFLELIRIYTKEPGKKPDLAAPYVLHRGATVLDLAERIHKDFAERMKFARIWGANAYSGQSVGRDHALNDKDVLELHI